jgi:CheY-like chemotaxis protein
MVLDLRLPDMTGFELLEKMRGDERAARPAGRRLHRQGADAEERRRELRRWRERSSSRT